MRASARIIVAILLIAAAGPAAAATRYDPRLRFRTIATPHFFVHFHAEEEALAFRLAEIVERVHDAVTRRLKSAPRRRTHVVLVDQTDYASGWATPLPYNIIELSAVAPLPDESIGYLDDWLTLVFTHEYTHVVHLDRSEGWAKWGRRVFGRLPPLFPNLYLPIWQIEGIATFVESADDRGRLHAGDFGVIVREAARAGRVEPLDRVNGGLVDWPSGFAPYAYGAEFHRFLADRYGEARLAELAAATARHVPYTGSRAFRSVFGRSLGRLWDEFERSISSDSSPTDPTPRRLTHHGFLVGGPRFDRTDASGRTVIYSLRDAHAFPAIYRVRIDDAAPDRVAWRAGGQRLGVGERAIVFDQLEVVRNVASRSDLYALDHQSGNVRRLTADLRLIDPDLAPDGRRIVAARIEADRRSLVLLDLEGPEAPEARGHSSMRAGPHPRAPAARAFALAARPDDLSLIASAADVQYAAPRWSPDGRAIVAERRQIGGPSEIVVIHLPSLGVSVAVSSTTARHVTPAWTPDGSTILFATAEPEQPFQLAALDVAEGGRFSDPWHIGAIAGGASQPDVSPDGKTIAFVGYTHDGYDVFLLPLDRSSWRLSARPPASDFRPPASGLRPHAPAAHPPAPATPYIPWASAAPRFWTPTLETSDELVKVGAATGGVDALGYHSWAASTAWTVAGRSAGLLANRGRPDWTAYYSYDRWRPTLFASLSDDTTMSLARDVSSGSQRLRETREVELIAGAYLPWRRVRRSQAILGALAYERISFRDAARALTRDRTAIRLGWSIITARAYGYSIGREEGASLKIGSEQVRRALGADGDADAATVDARGYVRAGGRHSVVAARAAFGASRGDLGVRRVFEIGGPGPALDGFVFERDAIALLRGFDRESIAGVRAAVVNVDYRVPLARVQRGRGTWPLFLRTLHGALFVDAGHAWEEAFRWRDVRRSAGMELSADVVAGYVFPVTIAGGVAWARDPARAPTTKPAAFVRIGRAF